MTNISLFHYACRGLHAPRDKYIFDRSAAEGFLKITINPENLKATYEFTGFSNGEKPSESNIKEAERSLKFYSRECVNHALMGIDMHMKYKLKKKLKLVTLKDVVKELNSHYDDVCMRKGSVHFQSQYVAALLENPQLVVNYLKNGGSTYVV